MRYQEPLDDELPEFDQSIVGSVVRLHLPLKSPSALLQVADMLRGLATQCELAASSSVPTAPAAISSAATELVPS
jgi:hypothetical protein